MQLPFPVLAPEIRPDASRRVVVSPGCIRHTSIHKAKGLDSKAVILIGMPPHKNLTTSYDHFSWFMAVSRARQLLAVVEG